MNDTARKCYSCDFHRQDCVFTSNSSRKRSHAASVGTGYESMYVHTFFCLPNIVFTLVVAFLAEVQRPSYLQASPVPPGA